MFAAEAVEGRDGRGSEVFYKTKKLYRHGYASGDAFCWKITNQKP